MPLPPQRTPEREEIITLEIGMASKPLPVSDPGRKVLLLDDRSDFREVIQDYLSTRGYQVTSVQSGIEGLREIMKGGFELIICDMMMPKMGGEMFYWAVTRVRPGTRDKFIFFTGHQNNPRIDFFFKRVNATVLFKPFSLSALDAAIRHASRKSSDEFRLLPKRAVQ